MTSAPVIINSLYAGERCRPDDACWYQVTPLSDLQSQVSSCLTQLAALADLPEGWDGSCSPRISQAALRGAIEFLSSVPEHRFPYPQIIPVTGGGLQLEFQSGARELEIEFLPDGTLAILTVDEKERMWETNVPSGNTTLYTRLLEWLNGR